MIEDGLYSLLSSNADVAALCGTRIYPLILPADPVLPCITYQRISTVPQYTMDGPTGFITARVQIDLWADSYSSAKALASAVQAVLDGFTGTLSNGVLVLDIRIDGALDAYEKDARLYREQTDFIVQFAQ